MDGVAVSGNYRGAALTLTDALSTLAVIGDARNFERSVNWLVAKVRPSPLDFVYSPGIFYAAVPCKVCTGGQPAK